MRSSQKNRNGRNKNGRKPIGNVINRVFESAGPEGKVRGTPQQIIDKYLLLARDAHTSGDRVSSENFLQHAEHYIRLLNAAQEQMEERRLQFQAGGRPDQEDPRYDEDDDGGYLPVDRFEARFEPTRIEQPRIEQPRSEQPRQDFGRGEQPRGPDPRPRFEGRGPDQRPDQRPDPRGEGQRGDGQRGDGQRPEGGREGEWRQRRPDHQRERPFDRERAGGERRGGDPRAENRPEHRPERAPYGAPAAEDVATVGAEQPAGLPAFIVGRADPAPAREPVAPAPEAAALETIDTGEPEALIVPTPEEAAAARPRRTGEPRRRTRRAAQPAEADGAEPAPPAEPGDAPAV